MHAQQAAHVGVHRGFPQLLGVHLAQAFVALAAGGALGLGQQPFHRLAEIADFFLLLAFAFAAHHHRAVCQQTAERIGGIGQRRVIRTVGKVLGDDAAFGVAVVVAADAQQGLVGANVKLGVDFGRYARGVEFPQLGLQQRGAGLGLVEGVQIQMHAIGHGTQGFAVHEVGQPRNHRFGDLVLTRQLRQGLARQGLRLIAACAEAGIFERNAHQKRFQRLCVFKILLLFSVLHLVQRRLSDVDVPTFHQLGHLPIEERQEQGADVCAIHVGIGHDDDAVVAQFVDVEVVRAAFAAFRTGFADARA